MSEYLNEYFELNKDRAMQPILKRDEKGNVVEDTHVICIDTYTLLHKREDDYCIVNIDPDSNEMARAALPVVMVSDEVKAIFPPITLPKSGIQFEKLPNTTSAERNKNIWDWVEDHAQNFGSVPMEYVEYDDETGKDLVLDYNQILSALRNPQLEQLDSIVADYHSMQD